MNGVLGSFRNMNVIIHIGSCRGPASWKECADGRSRQVPILHTGAACSMAHHFEDGVLSDTFLLPTLDQSRTFHGPVMPMIIKPEASHSPFVDPFVALCHIFVAFRGFEATPM